MVKLKIAIMRSTKTLSQTNDDVLAWYLIKNGKQSLTFHDHLMSGLKDTN
ncbi:hypothetical protein [Staphylococcus epidermidis]